MKKIFLIGISIALFCNWHFVLAERVNKYNVNIKINSDASINIIENIVYNFEDSERHGIYREIPIQYETDSGNNRNIKLKNINILIDGKSGEYKRVKEGENVKFYIGNENKLVTGIHEYQISYIILDAINYFDDHDELYWNAIGTEWNFNIDKAIINVEASNIQQFTSYKGFFGSEKNCLIVKQTDNKIVVDCEKLNTNEGVTIVVGLEKGILREPTFLEKISKLVKENVILLLPILIFFFMFRIWYKNGRDPKGNGVVVPYYDVPDDLSLGCVAYVMHGKLPNDALSAMIIQLAVKGWLKIKQTQKGKIFSGDEYTFYKTDKDRQLLSPEEKVLFDKLFSLGSNGKVKSDNLAYNFYRYIPNIKEILTKQVLLKQYFSNEPKKVVGKWIVVSVSILLFSIFIGNMFGTLFMFSGIISAIIIFGFGLIMPSYTRKGIKVKEKLLGFKLYLETAKKDRIKFHNAPEKKPEIFEKFLPYAMIFGVEKEWAEQFKDIYNSNPDWYETNADTTFGAMNLVNSLNSFGVTTTSAIGSGSISSSASSGGSGFSGGGTGGGFGGGGGGSW